MPSPALDEPVIEIHPYLWVLAALNWALRLVLVLVVIHKRRPNVALAWVVIVLFQPVAGGILFLLIGRIRIDATTTRRYASLAARSSALAVRRGSVDVPERFADLVRLSESLNLHHPTSGNRVGLVGSHAGFVGGLVEDIDRASVSVSVLYYIFLDDQVGRRVADALARAAGRGVRCRLLVDAVGSRSILSARAGSLRAAGVEVRAALPVRPWRALLVRTDIRNHRKLAVIDGRVAWAGSHNMCEDHYGHSRYGPWIDLTARLEGPAVVQLAQVFEEDWYAQTEEAAEHEVPLSEVDPEVVPEVGSEVVPEAGSLARSESGTGAATESGTSTGSGPGSGAGYASGSAAGPAEHAGAGRAGEAGRAVVQVFRSGPTGFPDSLEPLLIAAMHEAEERIVLTAPYFVPTSAILLALRIAVLRGVRVDVIVPARSNHPLVQAAGRASFEEVLESGVNIHLHSPGLLHSKTMLVDDSFALIGTANFDVRSIALNFELKLLIFDHETVRTLVSVHEQYLRASVPVCLDAWARRGRARRLGENLARLFTPLL